MTVPVVLIGGLSRRFGRDKLREPLANGGLLVDRPIAVLRAVFGGRVVGVGPAHPEVIGRVDQHLPDAWDGAGPAGGLLTVLDTFDAPVFLLSGDLPWITRASIVAVIEAAAAAPGADAVLAASVGSDGHCQPEPCIGIYRPSLRSRLRARLEEGNRRLWDLPEHPEYVILPAADLAGANTPEDLHD
jgi:molybdopterin-guanine dinucleotide biosynthesis protein A